jgi:hypothetical protein
VASAYQKRASAYLSSFIFGNAYNIDGFTVGTMNSDAFVTSLRILGLFMTLPLTKDEWPWVDNKEEAKQ